MFISIKNIRDKDTCITGTLVQSLMSKGLKCTTDNLHASKLNIIHDEQNGFRKDYNIIDHLMSITSIIESRKLHKQSTLNFADCIDFNKAYNTNYK